MSPDERADDAEDTPSPGGWATLEAKVRAQRFARCLERSRGAIDAGRLADAREALNEARTLAPDAPELEELERRMASQPSPGAVFLSAEPRALEPPSVWPRALAGMVSIVVLIGLVGFGIVQLRHAGPVRELLSLGRSLAIDEPDAPDSGPKPDTRETAATPVEPAGLAAPESIPDAPPAGAAFLRATPDEGPATAKPRHDPANGRTPAASTLTTSRNPSRGPEPGLADSSGRQAERVVPQPLSSGAPSGPPLAGGRPPAEAVALAMTGGSPTPTSTTGEGTASTAAADPPAASSGSPARAEPKYDESLRIRAVLLRYESAYNRLDARAASSVWPGVDQSALDRAFNSLISQKVSLGLCDITVIGDIGGASCAGKARWEPKVGGGLQTADRHWDFQLRKSADGWKIREIRVR